MHRKISHHLSEGKSFPWKRCVLCVAVRLGWVLLGKTCIELNAGQQAKGINIPGFFIRQKIKEILL